MKLKQSFITNSSSTSFVGFVMDWDDFFGSLSVEGKAKLFDNILADLIKVNKSWYKDTIEEMKSITDPEEKEEFLRDMDSEYLSAGIPGGFSKEYFAGQNYLHIGIWNIIKSYPEIKIGDMQAALVETINKEFGTSFTELSWIEEASCEG